MEKENDDTEGKRNTPTHAHTHAHRQEKDVDAMCLIAPSIPILDRDEKGKEDTRRQREEKGGRLRRVGEERGLWELRTHESKKKGGMSAK